MKRFCDGQKNFSAPSAAMERAPVRKKLVAALIGSTLLAGCTPTVGTAAVVDGEKISVASVQESVNEIVSQRAATGQPDQGDIADGQQAQQQLRFFIISLAIAKAAQLNGITITPAELSQYRASVIQQIGGEANLLAALAQNAIAKRDFELYLKDVLYQQKLSEKLVPGDATETATARREAFQKTMLSVLSDMKISVNPRFGIFDPTTSSLTLKDYTNGAVQPRS